MLGFLLLVHQAMHARVHRNQTLKSESPKPQLNAAPKLWFHYEA